MSTNTSPPAGREQRALERSRPLDLQPAALTCPWCESSRVECVGAFGAHLMVSQYICLECRSPFEWIRR